MTARLRRSESTATPQAGGERGALHVLSTTTTLTEAAFRLRFLFRKERPVASSDIPSELNQDRPHCHHYTFAHIALRQVAFEQPVACLGMLASPEAMQFLTDVWKRVDEHCRQRGEISTIQPAEFVVHRRRLGDYACAIVELPEPWFITGAHFVALILNVPFDRLDPEDRDVPLLYFTLERGASLDGVARTVLCGWTRDGAHCNFGNGPEPTLEAFVPFLEERLKADEEDRPLASFRPGS